MSIQTLSAYLVTRVKTLTPNIDIRYVRNYEDSKFDGYPAIAVTMKEWNGRFLTTATNERIYIFTIRIYQEIAKNNIGASQAEDQLRTLTDQLVALFDADTALGDTAIYARPIGGRTGWVPNQPIRIYETDIEVHDVVTAG